VSWIGWRKVRVEGSMQEGFEIGEDRMKIKVMGWKRWSKIK
jgi:hypothetical protein